MKTVTNKPSQTPKAMILRNDSSSISATKKSLQEIVRNRYVYQKSMLDEVVYNILYSASEKPLKERVNFKLLDQDLKAEMMNNGINIPYHFVVQTQDGREVYRCPDYTDEGVESSFSQVLFRNDPPNRRGIVRIHFPEMNSYIFSSVRFMIPSVIFTFVLLVTFIFTIVVIFRQKRYSEIKNDLPSAANHSSGAAASTAASRGRKAAGSAVKYCSGAMPVLSKLQRPLPVANSFLPHLGLRSSTVTRTAPAGADWAAANAAARPAAPPPNITICCIRAPPQKSIHFIITYTAAKG